MGRLNFDALRSLQNGANDLLHSLEIQRSLVDHRQEKAVNQVSEASLRMLDVCGVSKDMLLLVKQHFQDLQFTLRRATIGNLINGNTIIAHNCYRKKLKKETLECLNSLKAIKKGKPVISDQNLAMVVYVLGEVRVTTISIIESLLSLIAKPWLDRKSAKRSVNFGPKLKRVTVSAKSLYDIRDAMELQSAKKRMEAVEITIACIEVEFECILRRLIETRVLLLNILTN